MRLKNSINSNYDHSKKPWHVSLTEAFLQYYNEEEVKKKKEEFRKPVEAKGGPPLGGVYIAILVCCLALIIFSDSRLFYKQCRKMKRDVKSRFRKDD